MDTTEIPNDKLATLLIEQAKLDCELDVHTPEQIIDPEPWEWLDTASVDTVEADFDNYDHVIVHLSGETNFQEKKYAATHTDPAAYENVPCVVEISIWWDFEEKPEMGVEVYEE